MESIGVRISQSIKSILGVFENVIDEQVDILEKVADEHVDISAKVFNEV